jgi:hypothetical protein
MLQLQMLVKQSARREAEARSHYELLAQVGATRSIIVIIVMLPIAAIASTMCSMYFGPSFTMLCVPCKVHAHVPRTHMYIVHVWSWLLSVLCSHYELLAQVRATRTRSMYFCPSFTMLFVFCKMHAHVRETHSNDCAFLVMATRRAAQRCRHACRHT